MRGMLQLKEADFANTFDPTATHLRIYLSTTKEV